MSVEITWFGHNCWQVAAGEQRLIIDPFLDSSPVSPQKVADLRPTLIALSHGHFDHVADAVELAKQSGATVLAIFEIAGWLAKEGVAESQIVGMNLGGRKQVGDWSIKLVPALHSSSFPDGSYAGAAAGLVIEVTGKRLYFACDTALFTDMPVVAGPNLDLAVLPIGDLYTMGIDDSIVATRLLGPKLVAPCHYDTWPPIAQDAHAWAKRIGTETKSIPAVLRPGESLTVGDAK